MFPLFLKRTVEVLAPRLAVVFRRVLRLGSFPVCWRVTNVTPIPKCSPSSSVSNYRPISLTPILSKVFEHLVYVRKVKGKVFYGQELPSGESTTTERGVNYQLLAVMY